MSKLVTKKLSPKSVKQYEKISGFKTNGEVYLQTYDNKTQKKIDKLMEELYFPKKDNQ